jgi:hypothetical protein
MALLYTYSSNKMVSAIYYVISHFRPNILEFIITSLEGLNVRGKVSLGDYILS